MLHESAAQTQPGRVRLKSLTGTTSAEVEGYVNEGWHISHQEYVAMPTERGGKHAIHWCVTLRKDCQPEPRFRLEEAAIEYLERIGVYNTDDTDGGNPAPAPQPNPTTPPAEDAPEPVPAQVKYPWDLGTRVKLDGRCDAGAHHRGISVARDLIKAGLWDAQGEIRFTDVYKIHTALEFRGVTLRDLSVSYDERGDCFVRLATTDPVDPTNAIVPVSNDPRPTPGAPTPPPPKQQLTADVQRRRIGALIQYYDEDLGIWKVDPAANEADALNSSFLRDNPLHIPNLEVTHA
jgi:hypothetical protein